MWRKRAVAGRDRGEPGAEDRHLRPAERADPDHSDLRYAGRGPAGSFRVVTPHSRAPLLRGPRSNDPDAKEEAEPE